MSTANCPPTAAARSKRGSRPIPTTRPKSPPGASQADLIRARYGAVADEQPPQRLDVGRLARRRYGAMAAAAAAVVAAFLVGGAAGWTVARRRDARRRPICRAFTSDALDAYRLYTVEVRHPVEVPGDQRPHLVEWLSKRVGSPLRAPELDKMGLKLVGGRLLPGPTGATAFFMYEGPSGERFTLYCGRTSDQETALRYTTGEQNAAYYWVDQNLALCAERTGRTETSCTTSHKPPTIRSIGAPRRKAGERRCVCCDGKDQFTLGSCPIAH